MRDIAKTGAAGPTAVQGMPADLVDAVYRHNGAQRRIMLARWLAMGEAERERCRKDLESARLGWTRRKRCQRAAKLLLTFGAG